MARRRLSSGAEHNTFDWVMGMTDEIDDDTLAHDMIEVHGSGAATVARENARTAALAGQATQAKSWIRVLGIIQRRQAGQVSSVRTARDPSPATSH
jgi:hypothetical protein